MLRIILLLMFLSGHLICSGHKNKSGTPGGLKLVYKCAETDSERVSYGLEVYHDERSKRLTICVPLLDGRIVTITHADSLASGYHGSHRNFVTTLALYSYVAKNFADSGGRIVTGEPHSLPHYHHSHTYRKTFDYLGRRWLVYFEADGAAVYTMQIAYKIVKGTLDDGDYREERFAYSNVDVE